jgi:hypothetical protein
MGSYTMDSHNTTRFIDAHGKCWNVGEVQLGCAGPYTIHYGAITPLA